MQAAANTMEPTATVKKTNSFARIGMRASFRQPVVHFRICAEHFRRIRNLPTLDCADRSIR